MAKPIRARDVSPEPVEYLWRDRIPKGMFTLVAGKPDQGKGLFAAHLAAEVSQEGINVLYSAAEDSDSQITRPRLEAAGADLDRIILWPFALPANYKELVEIVLAEEIGLVVMDPWASHLSDGHSRGSEKVREIMHPFQRTMEATKCSTVIIEHVLKRVPKHGHPMEAIAGSGSGAPAVARASYLYGKDPEDPDRCILAKAKFNIGPSPKPLAFDIDVEDIENVGDVPMLMFDEELATFDPMRLFDTKDQPNKVGRPSDKRAAAAEWLTTYLAENGSTKAGVITEDAKQNGMNNSTLRRASEDMGIVKTPKGGGKNCTWDLPNDVKDLMGIPYQEAAPSKSAATVAEDSVEEAKQVADMNAALDEILADAAQEDGEPDAG